MTLGRSVLVLAFLTFCGVAHAERRWANFAEDGDVRYYLDSKTLKALPDNVYIFWVKSVAKNREYFKGEYNLNDVAYILTNYELDCAISRYRVRGTIMFDKNRREINKTVAVGDPVFEPVPPESMLELAQDEVCVKKKGAAEVPEAEEATAPAAAAPGGSAVPPPAEKAESASPAVPEEPPSLR